MSIDRLFNTEQKLEFPDFDNIMKKILTTIFNLTLTTVHMGPTHKVDVADDAKFMDVENIYQELEELPLGSSTNYPDIKTTVL